MAYTEQDSKKLIVINLKAGSSSAFRQLYTIYHNDIYAYSLSLLKSKARAKDLVQEVFMKIWLKRETLNPELSVKSFLFTITRNLAFNELSKAANKRKMREAVFYKSQKVNDPADQQLMEAHYEKIKQQALAELTPRCKLVFEMSRQNEMTYQEISEELGVSPNTVRNQMSSALSTIKEYLLLHGDVVFLLVFLAELVQ